MPGPDRVGAYHVVPFLPERNASVDTLRWARKRAHIPALLEVDVTAARRAIREHRRATGEGLSFTAWVVSCVARAAAEHPRVHALRRGRRRLVVFHEVDVTVLVEREAGQHDETLPMPVVVRHADRKAPREIHAEIRRAETAEVAPGASSIEPGPPAWLQRLFFRSPAWLRDLVLWRPLVRSPTRMKKTMGTVAVTAVGMAAPGVLAWGIPMSLHPLAVGVGGITRRDTAAGRQDVLGLTIVFDHDVVDGAPVGRFIHRLHELLTAAEGLDAPPAPGEHGDPAPEGGP